MKVFLCLLPLMMAIPVFAAVPRPLAGPVRDLRKEIDFERIGEFHLGPTGAMGWMHVSRNSMTGEARQILVTKVESGCPAEGILKEGDIILGVNEKLFSGDARKAFGRAIIGAETEKSGGKLRLIRWRTMDGAEPRQGKEEEIVVKLPVLGTHSQTAPYHCPKSERILEQAVARLLEQKDWGRFGDKALALLATGEKKYLPLIRDYLHGAKFAKPDLEISLVDGGLVCWGYGYHNLLLTEYYLVTGDEYVLPAIREYSTKIAMGQSSAGTWGHGFAWKVTNDGQIHGRLRGYGALNQAGLPCFLSLILAKKCGVEHPEIDAALARSSKFFECFVGHGSIGYGFHRPSLEIHANGSNGMSGNGKNGIAAVAFRLLEDEKATRFFSRLTASLSNTMEYGHSGNSYSYFWDVLGAHCGGPEMASAFLKELSWYHALTRKPDGRFVYQPLGGIYGKGLLDPTAAQVLIATMPRRALFLTGKEMGDKPLLSAKDVSETMAAGQWRLTDPASMSAEELIGKLDCWSPMGREWIAKHLSTKEGDFTLRLMELLKSEKVEARAGACSALGYQGEKAGAAVELLAQALTDEPVVAIPASYALARISKPAARVMPEILRAVLDREEGGEMRPIQQAMAFGLGYDAGRVAPLYFDGLLPGLAEEGNPLEGIDRKLLHPALAKLLKDPSGRTRGSAAFAFAHFTREDLAEMAQEVYDAVVSPAPHYRMFSDDARQQALNLLLKYRIAEGIPMALESVDLKDWGGGERLPHRWKILKAYGGSAKLYLPQLRTLGDEVKEGSEQRKAIEDVIETIEKDGKAPALVSLHSLVDEKLARDLTLFEDRNLETMACRALIKENEGQSFYQAACLRRLVSLQGEGARKNVEQALKSDDNILREAAEKLRSEKGW
jgi:hypothetical protein